MLKKKERKTILYFFSICGFVFFILSIMQGANKNWQKMIICNIVFIDFIYVLLTSILTFNIENCFMQLEAFVIDHNNKKESTTYPKVMFPLITIMMVFCIMIGSILCIITGLHQNWFVMSVLILIIIVIMLSFTVILLLMRVDILRNHLEMTIINTLEKKTSEI